MNASCFFVRLRNPATAWLALLATASFSPARAQTRPQSSPAKRPAAAPGATIVLPLKLIAGQRATLAVLDAAGRLTPRVVVEFGGGEKVTTDATGRAAFTAPPDAGVLLAHLPGLPVSGSTTIILPPPNASDGVQIFDYPRLITVTDRFSVDGFGFRGDADGNRAMLGGRPALVLAASPVALVLLPGPGVPEGPAQLWIEVGGRSPGLEPVTLVSLHVTATQKQLAQGEKGKLIVRVRGTDQRLEIEARNLTAQIIQLPRGNLQRVTSTGGAFNHAEIEMLGLQPGDFSVSARLVPGVTGLPDVEAARRQLLAARPLAPKEWRERLDRLIHRMEQDPRDVLHFRDELERMLAEKLEGQFGRLIEAAWRELLKH